MAKKDLRLIGSDILQVEERRRRGVEGTGLKMADRSLKQIAKIGTMSVNSHTAHALLADDTIDAVFEAQARREPNSIALIQDEVQITYGELNQRADALASRLCHSGVVLETAVGICLERSIEMIVAILAVLKAGGAYVPLDPSHPVSRLDYILSDSAPIVVVTTSCLRTRLPASYKQIICIDQVTVSEGCIGPVTPRSKSNNLAYVIYTSGSTGAPKGVMVEHGSVTRFIRDIGGVIQPRAQDTWVLVHSFAFDFSVLELWGSLLYGGQLVIASYETVRTPTAFLELLCAKGATVVSQTPSAFRQLVAAQEISATRPPLRVIILGGEAIEMKSIRRWQEVLGTSESPSVVNMYGPTETTVFVTAKSLTAQDAVNISNSSPIGNPLSGSSIHVRDANLQPVAAGAVGEIFVSGAGVARGYLNRPELTAQRFLACPAGVAGMTRMYRTGDRGREHPDGQLEYLGRGDFQVKIRGFRVELGEIEANLLAHLSIDEVVVIIREDVPGHERLTAYFTSRGEHSPTCAVLRTFLASRVPEYMIPTDFVRVQNLPLTSNGKIDRSALPKPVSGALDMEYHPPEGEIQEALASIWEELLGVERVGTEDNFFVRGGSSMLGMSLAAKVAEHFEINPGMAFVFQHPTVRQMAQFIQERVSSLKTDSLRPTASEAGMEEGTL